MNFFGREYGVVYIMRIRDARDFRPRAVSVTLGDVCAVCQSGVCPAGRLFRACGKAAALPLAARKPQAISCAAGSTGEDVGSPFLKVSTTLASPSGVASAAVRVSRALAPQAAKAASSPPLSRVWSRVWARLRLVGLVGVK